MTAKVKSGTPLVYSYLRFSSPEQLTGDSKRRQLEMSQAWAAQRGLTITDSLQDLGVSAFHGRNSTKGALGRFLAAVEAGKVPAGSVLLVEDLDRISREAPEVAVELFLGIVRAGVTVVTLRDSQEYSRGNMDMLRMMRSVMLICLAHEESAKKGKRVHAAWMKKQELAAKGQIMTKQMPFWLHLVDGRIQPIPEKARIVKEIFELAAKGFGIVAIQKKINAKYQNVNRAKFLSRTLIWKMLTERHVIGEYQPYAIVPENGWKKRVPNGEPIRDYYPAVISEDLYYAASASMKGRSKVRGKVTQYCNLFTGIIFHAEDKTPMILQSKRPPDRLYVSSAGANGVSKWCAIPARCMEIATMLRMGDVNLYMHTDEENPISKLEALEGEKATLLAKSEQIQGQVMNGKASPSVVALLGKIDARIGEVDEEIEAEKRRLAGSTYANKMTAGEKIIDCMSKDAEGELSNDTRIELREAFRKLVERLDVLPYKLSPRWYAADVTAKLVGDGCVSYRFCGTFAKGCYTTVLDTSKDADGMYTVITTDEKGKAAYGLHERENLKGIVPDSFFTPAE